RVQGAQRHPERVGGSGNRGRLRYSHELPISPSAASLATHEVEDGADRHLWFAFFEAFEDVLCPRSAQHILYGNGTVRKRARVLATDVWKTTWPKTNTQRKSAA